MGWRLWRTSLSNGRYIGSGDEAGMDLAQGRIRTLRTSFEVKARVAHDNLSLTDHNITIIKFSGSEF